MKRFVLVLLFIAQSFVFSQFSLIVNTYSQNFDGLGTTTSSGVTGGSLNNVNTSLNGWYFLETGSGSPNTEITAGFIGSAKEILIILELLQTQTESWVGYNQ
ncbi:MAG: hypothetical protein IPH34_15195 [Chitinophagaceae bacterium]|nr:hypothetical protein [Chitinophagaceae bacterium]